MGQVLLVRHGQASFGMDDYDVLSATGEEQAAILGRHLARTLGGVVPDLVVHGSLRRQRDTALIAGKAAGWDAPVETDARWDEIAIVGDAGRMAKSSLDSAREFQRWYEARTDDWLDGVPVESQESFVDFGARVRSAFDAVVGRGSTVVVVTSGGVVSALTAALSGGGAPVYRTLMPAMVNTSVTKVVTGRRGATLVSWNAHDHLRRDQVTYR